MYVFLIFALPLAFGLLFLLLYPAEERREARKVALKGLLLALPAILLARLGESLLPPLWGSPLALLDEWAGALLPYSLVPALGYGLFYRYRERLPGGRLERRLTAFYAGALAPLGLAEATRDWGSAEPYSLFLLPLLLIAILLALPALIAAFLEEYGFRRFLLASGAALASLAASLIPWLLLARLWPLAYLLALLLLGGAWLLARPGLLARPRAQA